jgi:uncharacterized protein (TIGR03000 family)
MNRFLVALLVGLAFLSAVTDAHAQLRQFGRPSPAVSPYTPNPYLDTTAQTDPNTSGRIPRPWPPYPWPPYPPYPYVYPPYYYLPIDPNPQSSYTPLPPMSSSAPTDTMPAPKQNRAVIEVTLPSYAAEVWVDDKKMADKLDTKRVFVSPPLEPGHDYVYTIKARWVQRGENVVQERPVVVSANKVSTVDFSKAPGK